MGADGTAGARTVRCPCCATFVTVPITGGYYNTYSYTCGNCGQLFRA